MGLFSRKTEDTNQEETKEAVQTEAPAVKSEATPKQEVAGSLMNGIILAPVISEKTHALTAGHTKYVFRVAKTATKHSVKKAVEEIYKVHVTNVHTITVPRKRRTVKYDRGFQKSYKKAIVTLRDGESITAFDLA